jgi:diguanylate cyclase (GGDEF)-like protein
MSNEIKTLLEDTINSANLTPLFQPIVCTDTPSLHGYEALIRGPSDTPLHSPLQLFDAAIKHNLLSELELICRKVSIKRFVELGLPGRLFLNVSPMIFLSSDHPEGKTLSYLKEAGLAPERVVIELSEKYPIDKADLLVTALMHYRNLGLKVAVDDLGTGYAGLKLWSEVKPDYVKIDRYFINEVHKDPIKREFVRSIINLGTSINASVIAEGIETEQEFNELTDLGVTMSQGYFFARPTAFPSQQVPAVLNKKQAIQRLSSHLEKKACALLQNVKTLDYRDSTGSIVAFFHDHPMVYSVPVLRDEVPIGMMIREQVLELFSKPYGRSLNEKKPVIETMMDNPVVVEADTNLEEIAKMLTTDDDEKLMMHFIITHRGKYIGIGSVRDLLRQLTQQQLQHASYSNPLTLLPGNVPIYRQIHKLLTGKQNFHIAYLDLNNFKPYNDVYGYAKGDQVIQLLASLLHQHCSPSDFIGHIGGDDFVAIFTDESWDATCRKIIAAFDRQIPEFYKKADLKRGGIIAMTRTGQPQRWPLLGLAIGVVCPDPERCHSHHDVAALASNAKKEAKRQHSSSVFLCRRKGPMDTIDIHPAPNRAVVNC